MLGLAGCKEETVAGKAAPAAAKSADASHVAPGQLDTYYAFISAGHGGEVRVLGLPSGRTLKRIPVFNTDCMVGWGITNESKAVMGTKADGSLRYFYHLAYDGESPDAWDRYTDFHTFRLFWAPLANLPQIVSPQDEWVQYVRETLGYGFE